MVHHLVFSKVCRCSSLNPLLIHWPLCHHMNSVPLYGISSWKRSVFLACITIERFVNEISTMSLVKLITSGNKLSYRDGLKVSTSNFTNDNLEFLSWNCFNQDITESGFSHWLILVSRMIILFILSNIFLLTLPMSDLEEKEKWMTWKTTFLMFQCYVSLGLL